MIKNSLLFGVPLSISWNIECKLIIDMVNSSLVDVVRVTWEYFQELLLLQLLVLDESRLLVEQVLKRLLNSFSEVSPVSELDSVTITKLVLLSKGKQFTSIFFSLTLRLSEGSNKLDVFRFSDSLITIDIKEIEDEGVSLLVIVVILDNELTKIISSNLTISLQLRSISWFFFLVLEEFLENINFKGELSVNFIIEFTKVFGILREDSTEKGHPFRSINDVVVITID